MIRRFLRYPTQTQRCDGEGTCVSTGILCNGNDSYDNCSYCPFFATAQTCVSRNCTWTDSACVQAAGITNTRCPADL